MRIDPAGTLAAAWALFRRDRALLLGLAGLFWFLPTLALRLLVPLPPTLAPGMEPGSDAALAALQGLADWIGMHGGWYVAAGAIDYWGVLTLFVLYLDPVQPTLHTALGRAARLWPRFFLLNAIVALPVFAGLWLYAIPGIYLLARILLAGPALVAEAPLGASGAIARSFGLSRGTVLPLMALAAATLTLALLGEPLLVLDRWLRARVDGPNPAALLMTDALAATVATAAALAGGLVAIVAYRRLASEGLPPRGGVSR